EASRLKSATLHPEVGDGRKRSWWFRAALGARQFLKSRFGHARFPGRVAQFEAVAAGVEEVKLPAGKVSLGAIVEPVDANFSLLKDLACLHQSLRTDRERMMHVLVFGKRLVDIGRALAEKN